MGPADYRMMSEATGQRIAAALEALSGFGSYLTTADVVDNLTNTDPTKVLAAPQGKALNDKINNQFGGMNSFTLWMSANTSFVITSEEQHQVFIITADATGGEFPFIIAGNGGVLSLGQIGSASWNSALTKLTVNISSARTVLILSTNKINVSWS